MIPGSANPLLLASAAAGPTEYQISRSVRFNAPDSAYLSRTPSVAGNRKTWTWAGWVKRGQLGGSQGIFTSGTSNANLNPIYFGYNSADTVAVLYYNGNFQYLVETAPVFRDPSAWYHVLIAYNSTQITPSDRVRIFVNRVKQTSFISANYPAQNLDGWINAVDAHAIGAAYATPSVIYSGLLADVHFIDGQALDPTSFTEVDATTGQLVPIEYTGTYGTNGFHLPFSDNSTAAALGTDTSGNSNNWTVNNISVAAGAGNDSLVDTPTSYGTDTGAGGEVRGNYCTGNPLARNTYGSTLSFANGNLDWTYSGNAFATIATSSGKWYAEVVFATTVGSRGIGIAPYDWSSVVAAYFSDGTKYLDNVNSSYSGATFTSGDVIGIAWNADYKQVTFYKNNVSQGAMTYTNTKDLTFVVFRGGTEVTNTCTWNFGQRPFAYPAPSGFKALCTTNLPEPQTITTSGSYTGNGLADGPFVYLNGVPTAMTVNGTAVTFGTHADKLSNGLKVRTTSTTYNQNAATYNYSVTSTGPTFKTARAQSN